MAKECKTLECSETATNTNDLCNNRVYLITSTCENTYYFNDGSSPVTATCISYNYASLSPFTMDGYIATAYNGVRRLPTAFRGDCPNVYTGFSTFSRLEQKCTYLFELYPYYGVGQNSRLKCKCTAGDQEINCLGATGGICCIPKSKLDSLCNLVK